MVIFVRLSTSSRSARQTTFSRSPGCLCPALSLPSFPGCCPLSSVTLKPVKVPLSWLCLPPSCEAPRAQIQVPSSWHSRAGAPGGTRRGARSGLGTDPSLSDSRGDTQGPGQDGLCTQSLRGGSSSSLLSPASSQRSVANQNVPRALPGGPRRPSRRDGGCQVRPAADPPPRRRASPFRAGPAFLLLSVKRPSRRFTQNVKYSLHRGI